VDARIKEKNTLEIKAYVCLHRSWAGACQRNILRSRNRIDPGFSFPVLGKPWNERTELSVCINVIQ
jgi:hypothetical protein